MRFNIGFPILLYNDYSYTASLDQSILYNNFISIQQISFPVSRRNEFFEFISNPTQHTFSRNEEKGNKKKEKKVAIYEENNPISWHSDDFN